MLNVQFIGRLGLDSELRTAKESGKQFLSFRAATDDFSNGERTTTWVRVTWTSDRAVKMQEYLKKGSQVSVHGVLRASIYQNKNGVNEINYDVFADRIDFVNSSSGSTKVNEATTSTASDFGKLQKQGEAVAASASADDLPF